MSNGTKVVKRNGVTESLDLDKIHKMVESAVRISQVFLHLKWRFSLVFSSMMESLQAKFKKSLYVLL